VRHGYVPRQLVSALKQRAYRQGLAESSQGRRYPLAPRAANNNYVRLLSRQHQLLLINDRLTTGQATGIDIWSTEDQSGKASNVTLLNASLEGVSDRVQIETGEMRALKYPDASFDLIVSSFAIHNIRGNADRRRAIVEGFRVLKPEGRIVIADIRAT
jgi:SAM-dependent methyltransferase